MSLLLILVVICVGEENSSFLYLATVCGIWTSMWIQINKRSGFLQSTATLLLLGYQSRSNKYIHALYGLTYPWQARCTLAADHIWFISSIYSQIIIIIFKVHIFSNMLKGKMVRVIAHNKICFKGKLSLSTDSCINYYLWSVKLVWYSKLIFYFETL